MTLFPVDAVFQMIFIVFMYLYERIREGTGMVMQMVWCSLMVCMVYEA